MARKKVFEEEPEEEFEWDKSRIIIFFVVLVVLIGGGLFAKHYFLDSKGIAKGQQSTVGVSLREENISSQLPSSQDIQQKIADLQHQATKISVQDIASSSPQVQEVLQQLQKLPELPGDIAKQTCIQLCGKL